MRGPQCVRVNVCKSDRLRGPNTVGFIPHGGKQCSDVVCTALQHCQAQFDIQRHTLGIAREELGVGLLECLVHRLQLFPGHVQLGVRTLELLDNGGVSRLC
jgi:hypothetical protein